MNQWVVVVGGTNMDVVARTSAPLVPATSNPGHTRISPGGVGRNIAACLGLLGAPVRLVSAVGDDAFGDEVLRVTAACGADVGAVRRVPGATGTYTAVLDDRGELVAAVSDMATVDALELDTLHLADAALVVVDGNLACRPGRAGLRGGGRRGGPGRLRTGLGGQGGALGRARARPLPGDAQRRRARRPHRAAGRRLARFRRRPPRPRRRARLAALRRRRVVGLHTGAGARCTCPRCPRSVVDVTGAGDAMLAAWIAAWLRGADPVDAAREGHRAAAATIESSHTVRPDLADVLRENH